MKTRLFALLVLVGLLVAACGPTATAVVGPAATDAPQPTQVPAAATEQPIAATEQPTGNAAQLAFPDASPDQILRLNTGSSGVASFTFYPMSSGGDHQALMPFLFVPPLYFDVDLNLKPGVFSTWKPNADFTSWTFTIDPRAQWSDGSKITSADVKGTYEMMANPTTETGRIRQYLGSVEGFTDVYDLKSTEITGLKIVDETTIEFKLIKPDPVYAMRLATTHMNPLKIENYKADPQKAWLPESNPVYSGPYMLESYGPDQGTAVMVPNPNWWMDEGPYLSRIDIHFQPDQELLAVELQNNQVDASIGGLPFTMLPGFPDYFRTTKSFGFNSFWLSATDKPTDDINVRKALVLAIDQEQVFKAAYPMAGEAIPATGVIDPDLPCNDKENTWYKQDIEAAKAALAASTYGSAENLPKLRVSPRGADPSMNRALESVVEQWRQNLGITNIEFQVKVDGFGEDAKLINLSRDDAVIRFPDAVTYMYVATHRDGPMAIDMMQGFDNAEINLLLENAATLSTDDPKRCESALKAQQIFMDQYHILFFGIQHARLSSRAYVGNYYKGPDVGQIEPWKIYIKEH